VKAKKAVVIGSGIAGLAVAIRLRHQGYDVTVFEAGEQAGGKLGEIEKDGFRWDSGPSLFTMPHFLEERFELSGKKMQDYIPYERKEVICNYFWEDGSRFSMLSDLDRSYQRMSELFNEPISSIQDYFNNSLRKYQLTAPIFLESSLHKLSSYLNKATLKALLNTHKLDIGTSLHDLNQKQFKDQRLVQLLDRFATYNGSSPYETSGIMSMIPSLEMQYGTFFPKKGMRSIADGLFQLATEIGIEFHFNEKVEEIKTEDKAARSIHTTKGDHQADLIVCNMDVWFAYHQLLKAEKKPKSLIKSERSSSALIFYWGIDQSFPELDLHNIFFSDRYEEEFEAIFKKGTLIDDPTVYINISSKQKTDDAPKGRENWFVMINAPANNGQDWEQMKDKAKESIVAKLSRILGLELGPLIMAEEVLDPISIEEKTSSYGGSLYGSSSNSNQSAFLRHPNFSKQYKGLYFVGGSVHPGGGIPLCLQSAKITSKIIAEEYQS
jgi:phytoene desaturase